MVTNAQLSQILYTGLFKKSISNMYALIYCIIGLILYSFVKLSAKIKPCDSDVIALLILSEGLLAW